MDGQKRSAPQRRLDPDLRRAALLFHSPSQPADIQLLGSCSPQRRRSSGFTSGVNSAILRYVGAAIVDPVTPQTTSLRAMNETQLQPLTNPAAPGPAVSAANSNGTVFPLSFNIALAGGAFTVNGASFVPPSVPVLLQILSGTTAAQSLLPSGSVYSLPP